MFLVPTLPIKASGVTKGGKEALPEPPPVGSLLFAPSISLPHFTQGIIGHCPNLLVGGSHIPLISF